MADQWVQMHISDANGAKSFSVDASPMSAPGQLRELQRHLDAIKRYEPLYKNVGIDPRTACIIVDGISIDGSPMLDINDDDLLEELLK
jgi:hypothetical protein